MKRSVVETLLGALVLFVALGFLTFSYSKSDISAGSGGRIITADFAGIGGLKPGDDVQISGVKVGSVQAVDLVPETYMARVSVIVDRSIQIPADTAALISSESLLGGRYMALEPGAEEEMLEDGGHIEYTQAPQNLEQLLGKFIFSMQGGDKNADQSNAEGF